MKKMMIILIAVGLLFQPLFADEKAEILKVVKKQIDIVIDTLRRKDLDKKTKDQRIIAAIVPFFDFELMAKLSLGKEGLQAMNEKQRAEFSELFVKRLQESYLEKLKLYTDEEVAVEEAVQVNTRIHVITQLVSKNDKMKMVYQFYQKDKVWMVYDVEILGVSIVQTYRSQFSGILKDSSVEELLKRLRVSGGTKALTGSE